MKFFDYTEIPNKDYQEAINIAITYINLKLPKHNNDLFKLLAKEDDKSKILEAVKTYTESLDIDDESLDLLKMAAITLYECVNGRLQSVCEAYEINQGHLGDAKENDVYKVVKSMALKEMSAGDEVLLGDQLPSED